MKLNDIAILPKGYGAWDITRYSMGGKFTRMSEDTIGTITDMRENFNDGYVELTIDDDIKLAVEISHLR